jgi:iron complex transport system substrate-binding protein
MFATFDIKVYDAIRTAAKVVNRRERAEQVIEYIESLRKDLQARVAGISDDEKPGVYVGGIGYRGAKGIESTEQKYTPFEWIGANNLALKVEASAGTHVFMDKEKILHLNPDIVFLDGGGLALVKEDYDKKPEFYNALNAFSQRRVCTLFPYNFYTTNIGTAAANAFAIGKILYMSRFEDVHPEKKADEIYSFLVGAPVYQDMKRDYGVIGQVAPFL